MNFMKRDFCSTSGSNDQYTTFLLVLRNLCEHETDTKLTTTSSQMPNMGLGSADLVTPSR